MSDYTSIDELLTGQNKQEIEHEKPNDEYGSDSDGYSSSNDSEPESSDNYEENDNNTNDNSDESEDEQKSENSEDDYGNLQPKARTYTEDEHKELVNKAVRDRLARLEKNQPQAIQQQQTQQKQQSDFNYNPESNESWESQLESFVEQTVSKMGQRDVYNRQAQREAQATAEFESKFVDGMGKFTDFVDVVSAQPVTDAMTIAMRGIDNPAAFIYAASKRHPQELQRISKIEDPTRQIVEMGKLEERMRKNKASSSAPKPLSRTTSDAQSPDIKVKKEQTIEDLIAKSDAKKRAILNQRRGR